MDRVHPDHPARPVIDDHPAVEFQIVGQREHREVTADVLHEPGLVAEDQPPDVRVQPVGPDHEAEPARVGGLERDVDTVAVVVQSPDRVPEKVSDSVTRRAGQDLRQLAAQDLDVPDRHPGRDLAHVERDRRLPVALEQDQFGTRARPQDLWEYAQSFRLHRRMPRTGRRRDRRDRSGLTGCARPTLG